MNTTNLLSKLTNSNELETVHELNQALECFGVDHKSVLINQSKVIDINRFIIEKFTNLVDLRCLAQSIKEHVSLEELECFKNELKLKLELNSGLIAAPVQTKRMATLKTCFEGASGDSVL
jgi:hypothetical protein